MSEQLRELYQQTIIDHSKEPRHFGKLAGATTHAEGFNPLCGDHYTVFLRMDGERIAEASFQGAGCAISKASADLMAESVRTRSRKDAERLMEHFHKLVTKGKADAPQDELGKLWVFAGVSDYPARVKCATLAWHALKAALKGDGKTVTTE